MTELPDTSWDRDYRKRTRECIDAAAEAVGKPSPRMLPASGPEPKSLGIGRGWSSKMVISTVETKEDEA